MLRSIVNFALGFIFLFLAFHYLAFLPSHKSMISALLLSTVIDAAYIARSKIAERRAERKKKEPMTFGNKVTLALLSIVSAAYGTLVAHHILVLPLAASFIVGVALAIAVDAGYLLHIRKRTAERRVYSIRHFLLESLFAFLISSTAYLAGIDAWRSVSMGLYIYVLIHWYYNFLPHRYVFTRNSVIFRTALTFLAVFSGYFTLVGVNFALSAPIAALAALMLEFDRRSALAIARNKSEEEMEAIGRKAGALFQGVGYIYGGFIGVMTVSKIYGTWYLSWWLLELYRIAYIFTVTFLVSSALMSRALAKSRWAK